MTKDRFAALKAAQEESTAELGEDGEVSININDEGCFMETFFKEVQEITDTLDHINEKVVLVAKKQSDILTDPALDEKLKRELEEIMSDIKSLTDGVRKKLNMMEQSIDFDETRAGISADTRIRRIQHSTLMHKFLEIMTEYNITQVTHRDRCKERIQRQLTITGKTYTNQEIDEMLESGNPAIFIQGINTEEKMAKQTLTDIKARHADILKLEKSIKELHDLFVDLGCLVDEQGKMVDHIEFQVRNTSDYVENAKETTRKAIQFQQSARRKKLIIILLVVVLLFIIILIIGLSLGLKQ